jgi:hypothetical protein
VAELQTEGGALVGQADLLRARPHGGDLVGRHARPDQVDRRVEPLAAATVGIELRRRRVADVERAVVAGAVAVEGVDDVEEDLIARAQKTVGEGVWMRASSGRRRSR